MVYRNPVRVTTITDIKIAPQCASSSQLSQREWWTKQGTSQNVIPFNMGLKVHTWV